MGFFIFDAAQGVDPMTPDQVKRKLAAILSADAQVYRRLMVEVIL
jgi:hypothetical protein